VTLKSVEDIAEVLPFLRNITFIGKTTVAVSFLQRRQRKKEKKKQFRRMLSLNNFRSLMKIIRRRITYEKR
jgi:hypothetical protein